MKKIFCTMLCACGLLSATTPAVAQSGSTKVQSAINTITPDWMPPFKLGVTAGFNASTFSHGGFETLCGFQVGLDAMVDMSNVVDNTYLRTGLQLVRKGAKQKLVRTDIFDQLTYNKVKYRPCYLQIPVRYGYGYVLEDDCVFFGEAGPYVAVGVGGKARVTTVYGTELEEHRKRDFFDDADRFDLGFGLHAGVILCKDHQLSLGYDFGLLNMSDNYAQNRSFMLSYTYYFK
jgi:hypothetical protein